MRRIEFSDSKEWDLLRSEQGYETPKAGIIIHRPCSGEKTPPRIAELSKDFFVACNCGTITKSFPVLKKAKFILGL